MTGLQILAAGHAFVQNQRRGHYEIATDQPAGRRLAVAFAQLAKVISTFGADLRPARHVLACDQCNRACAGTRQLGPYCSNGADEDP